MKARLLLVAWVVGCGSESEVDREADGLDRLIRALGLDVIAAGADGLGQAPAGPDGLGVATGAGANPGPDGTGRNQEDGTPPGLGQAPSGGSGLGGSGTGAPGPVTCADICPLLTQCLAEQGADLELDECIEGCQEELIEAGPEERALVACLGGASTCGEVIVCLRRFEDDEEGEANDPPPQAAPGRAPQPIE